MRNRVAAVLLLCLISVPACTVWREHSTVNTWSQVTGGESLERSFWHDVKAKDWKELERHVASNYMSTTPTGQLNRDAALEYLQQFQIDDYSLGNFQVEMNGSTLVVAYTLVIHGTLSGQPVPASPLHIMGVWQHQKKDWVAIAHSGIGAY